MIQENLQSALATLKAERSRLDRAIAEIEGLLSGAPVAPEKARRATATEAAVGEAAQQRAPRGLLKKTILEVLKSSRRPLAPYELRDAVIAAGYPVKNKATLYTTIFTTAKADKRIRKTKDGFSLIR